MGLITIKSNDALEREREADGAGVRGFHERAGLLQRADRAGMDLDDAGIADEDHDRQPGFRRRLHGAAEAPGRDGQGVIASHQAEGLQPAGAAVAGGHASRRNNRQGACAAIAQPHLQPSGRALRHAHRYA